MQNFRALLGAPPPDPQDSSPHCEFLATRLLHMVLLISMICLTVTMIYKKNLTTSNQARYFNKVKNK